MCGIAGVVTLNGSDAPVGTAARMRDRIAHRGPDGNGEHDGPGVSLAACRLAIVDLDPRGLMPMATPDGRYRIVHNGEIYNRLELRADLERTGISLRTTTDTEVLLHLYAAHGPAMLDRLDGMFAFAIWDAERRELFAARDRCGEKPFFYAEHEGRLYFASEPKALFAAGVPCRFDEDTWAELMTFGAVAGDRTPYHGVKRILPGHWLSTASGSIQTFGWWEFKNGSDDSERGTFGTLFDESVQRRMIADVPVGTLLSGGLDSSSVTMTAARDRSEPVHAFTVRFDNPAFDEGSYARAVADRAGVTHHELKVPVEERPALLADATWYLDEPLSFNAAADLVAISRFAREHVRVLLTGESADELFGGYGRFRQYRYLTLFRAAGPLLRPFGGRLRPGSRLDRAARAGQTNRAEWIAATHANGNVARVTRAPLAEFAPFRAEVARNAVETYDDPVIQALAYERATHLASVLDNADRMTMGAAIEARLPFTAPGLLELAGRATRRELFHGQHGKRPLREAMIGKLPDEVLSRRKRGWTSDYRAYLRGHEPLRRWLAATPDHPITAASPLGTAGARTLIDGFLAGDDQRAWEAWMLGRVVLWHQVCVEGVRRPIGGA